MCLFVQPALDINAAFITAFPGRFGLNASAASGTLAHTDLLNRIWYQAASTHGSCAKRDTEKPFRATSARDHAKRITEAETVSPGVISQKPYLAGVCHGPNIIRRNQETRKPIRVEKRRRH